MNKILPLILISTLPLAAQTVTTNWVTAAPNFREVNGKLYNTEKSTNWVLMKGTCEAVSSNGIVVISEPKPDVSFHGFVSGNQSVGAYIGGGSATYEAAPARPYIPYDSKIWVKHYPAELPVASGVDVKAWVMPVGLVTNSNGERLKAYDCGTPHCVPVVTTAKTASK